VKDRLYLGLTVLIWIFSQNAVNSQETLLTSGKDISGEGGSVSYSVGQVVYTTHFGAVSSIAEGIQQAYEISVFTDFKNIKGISLKCSAYPNPTTDLLYLKVDDFLNNNLSYKLFNVEGRLLKSGLIEASETTIPMFEYVPSSYFLTVLNSDLNLKTFKIIKH